MGVFSRINDIVQSNLNAMLDKAEDPEKLLSLIISEMEESLVELRSVAAKHLADQKTSQRKLDALDKKSNDWQAKAQKAVSKNRDDLARAALIEKQKVMAEQESIQEFNKVVTEQLQKLQEDSARITSKIAEAKAKRKALTTRMDNAKVRMEIKSTAEQFDVDKVMQKFERYESRIDHLEAQVDAYDVVSSGTDLNAQFKELEANDEIEAQLESLKKKVA
jgi:phage shock protein A